MRAVFLSLILLIVSNTVQSGENPFIIDSLGFDRQTHIFRVKWHTDSASVAAGTEFGIALSCNGSIDPPFNHSRAVSLTGDTLFTIPDMVYDTSYKVGLWAYSSGLWIKPDSLSEKIVRVSSVSSQPVSIFAPAKVKDTVRALSNTIIMWKDSTYKLGIPEHRDTVISYLPADTLLKGFIRLSTGFRFVKPEPALPFYISLSIDSIPLKWGTGKICIYRDSAGMFIPENSSVVDSVNKRIVLKTADLRLPLIVLADTLKPAVTFLSKVSKVIGQAAMSDTLMVSDNSADVKWKFISGQGVELQNTTSASGIIAGKTGRVICMFSPAGVQINGIRAKLICSDGVNTDTVDLSKTTVRTNSDPVTLTQNMITPVYTTTKLDSAGVRQCLGALFRQCGGKYDLSKFRIYKWSTDAVNAANNNKWIEYSSLNESNMTLTPGKMLWVISDKTQLIDMGRGTTLPFIDTVSIELPAKSWTDFNNPYGFNLRISDIIKASAAAPAELTIYKWTEDRNGRTYRTSLVYNSVISAAATFNDTLYAKQSGYTVYNNRATPVVMRFAANPFNNGSVSAMALKKEPENNTAIKISAFSGNCEIGTVYCGIHKGTDKVITCPVAPSFGNNSLIIKDLKSAASCGIVSYPFNENTPAVYDIEIRGDGASATISAEALNNSGFQAFALFRKTESGYETLTDNKIDLYNGEGHVTLVAGSTASISFFANNNRPVKTTARSASLKPFCGLLKLETSQIDKCMCQLEIFTLDGSLVMSEKFEHIPGNSRQIHFKGSTGIYTYKMKFIDSGKVIYSAAKKFSLLQEVR